MAQLARVSRAEQRTPQCWGLGGWVGGGGGGVSARFVSDTAQVSRGRGGVGGGEGGQLFKQLGRACTVSYLGVYDRPLGSNSLIKIH